MEEREMDVRFPSKVPLAAEPEVLVVGGGPGGIGAAVAAARGGRRVMLAEHYGFLGGMATAGEVNPFMPNHIDNRSLDEGIFEEWRERMAAYGGLRGRVFDPSAARLAAEDLCVEAGVTLRYHHRVVHVEAASRKITGVVLHSKSGLCGVRAQLYIDGTGDGDVCALAGCEFEFGGEHGAFVQPMTTCFKVRLDPGDYPEQSSAQDGAGQSVRQRFPEQFKLIQQVYKEGKDAGRLRNQRQNVLMFAAVDNDVIHFNSTRVIQKSPIDGGELSEAEIEGRRQVVELMDLLRANVPLFAHARICSIATQIGVRESRRVLGRHYLTRQDFTDGRTFPDGIVRCRYPIDIHSSSGQGTEIVRLPEGAWYEVPYGCLVPKDMDNLLIGSRCISADSAVHGSVRVMPPVCSLGQASGTAAAMSLAQGILPCELDGESLKDQLIKDGRNLVPYDPARPCTAQPAERTEPAAAAAP